MSGEHIGGDEHTQFVGLLDRVTHLIGLRGEAPGQRGRVLALAGSFVYPIDAKIGQLGLEVARGVGELGEDQQLLLGVLLADQVGQRRQLGVGLGPPVAAGIQHSEQRLGVNQQILGQRLQEECRWQPFEAGFQWAAVCLIGLRGAISIGGLGLQAVGYVRVGVLVAFVVCEQAIGVFVVVAGIQKFGALRSKWNVQTVLQRMQHDEVAQDVALHGQDEGRARTLQPLEQVGAAKAHQARACARQAADGARLFGRRRRLWLGRHVVADAIARQDQVVDGIDDGAAVEAAVRICGVGVVDLERQVLGYALGEVGLSPVGEEQVAYTKRQVILLALERLPTEVSCKLAGRRFPTSRWRNSMPLC